jgi:hypothetical protein
LTSHYDEREREREKDGGIANGSVGWDDFQPREGGIVENAAVALQVVVNVPLR